MEILQDIKLPHEDGGGSRPVIINNDGILDALTQGADGTYLSGVGSLSVPEIETMYSALISKDETLDNSSATNQLLNPNGSTYTVTLSTTSITTGKHFNIMHTGTIGSLVIKEGSTTLITLYPKTSISVIFTGTHWIFKTSSSLTREGNDFLGFAHKAVIANADRFIIEDNTSSGKRYITFEEILESRGLRVITKEDDETDPSITLHSDDELTFDVEANSVYLIEALIDAQVSADGLSISSQWSIPSGTFVGTTDVTNREPGSNSLVYNIGINYDLTTTYSLYVAEGNPAREYMKVKGILRTSSTAGTVNFKWCLTAGTGSVTVFANSYVKVTKQV